MQQQMGTGGDSLIEAKSAQNDSVETIKYSPNGNDVIRNRAPLLPRVASGCQIKEDLPTLTRDCAENATKAVGRGRRRAAQTGTGGRHIEYTAAPRGGRRRKLSADVRKTILLSYSSPVAARFQTEGRCYCGHPFLR